MRNKSPNQLFFCLLFLSCKATTKYSKKYAICACRIFFRAIQSCPKNTKKKYFVIHTHLCTFRSVGIFKIISVVGQWPHFNFISTTQNIHISRSAEPCTRSGRIANAGYVREHTAQAKRCISLANQRCVACESLILFRFVYACHVSYIYSVNAVYVLYICLLVLTSSRLFTSRSFTARRTTKNFIECQSR